MNHKCHLNSLTHQHSQYRSDKSQSWLIVYFHSCDEHSGLDDLTRHPVTNSFSGTGAEYQKTILVMVVKQSDGRTRISLLHRTSRKRSKHGQTLLFLYWKDLLVTEMCLVDISLKRNSNLHQNSQCCTILQV